MESRRLHSLSRAAVLVCAVILLSTTATSADEIQLAGIRLGHHALDLMRVYGQPDGVYKGAFAGRGAGGQAAGAGAGGGMAGGEAGPPGGGPGMGMGGPGMGGEMGAMAEAGNTAGMMMGALGGLLGGMAGGGQPTAGASPQAGSSTLGAWSSAGDAPGGRPPSPTGFRWNDSPDWADPVNISLQPEETQWVYRRGAVVVGFVLDRDGYVVAIAVAGIKCDWARTAMWDKKRSVKLGDSYDTVIKRYGYPTRTQAYDRIDRPWPTSQPGLGVGGIGNASRDMILQYTEGNNIMFLVQDMKVVRIHIWEPEARPPASRNVAGGARMTAGGGMEAGMGEMMGPGGMPGMP